ncbi:MAG: lysylphosphatidylglycerol synthase domain-containing protein [Pseudomonadota bacterium]
MPETSDAPGDAIPGGIGLRHGDGVALALGVVAAFAVLVTLGSEAWQQLPAWVLAGVALLYLLSHALRAIRLTLLATPGLGISARSAALLHLATAPAGLLLPFKLGELVRLHELRALSGNGWLLAAMILLIDRMMDAVLLVVLFVVAATIAPTAVTPVFYLSVAFLVIAVVTFTVVPRALTQLQRYTIVFHNGDRAPRWLASVDKMRQLCVIGARRLVHQGGMLLLITLIIWSIELLAMAILLIGLPNAGEGTDPPRPIGHGALTLLLSRTASEWQAIIGLHDAPLQRLAAVISLAALMLVFPISLRLYLRERRLEPTRRSRSVRWTQRDNIRGS